MIANSTTAGLSGNPLDWRVPAGGTSLEGYPIKKPALLNSPGETR